jgi:hypothetical protein
VTSSSPTTGPSRLSLTLALLGTVAVGVGLRWTLVGMVSLPVPFSHLRHAHSHLGYYGLLFPLAWLGWQAAGAPLPGRLVLSAYAACTATAFIGFAVAGYGPVAITASTVIAVIWLHSVAPLVRRMVRLHDPLGAVPLGLVASLACVPPIALNLRSDPSLAAGFISTFLAGLLFVVIIPSALAARRISPGPWPLLLVAGGLAAAALGVAPSVPTRAGLVIYSGLLLAPAFAPRLASHARCVWVPVSAGLLAMAVGVLPNTRPVALGAIHFLILGPILATLAPLWMRRPPSPGAWWFGHALWGAMSAALVAQAFVADRWTWIAAAAGGTGAALWWLWALVRQTTADRM